MDLRRMGIDAHILQLDPEVGASVIPHPSGGSCPPLVPFGMPCSCHPCRLLGFFFLRFLLFDFKQHLGVEDLGSLRNFLREDLLNPTSPGFHAPLAFRHLFVGPPLSLFLLLHEEALPFPEMARTPSAPVAFFCPFSAFFSIGN